MIHPEDYEAVRSPESRHVVRPCTFRWTYEDFKWTMTGDRLKRSGKRSGPPPDGEAVARERDAGNHRPYRSLSYLHLRPASACSGLPRAPQAGRFYLVGRAPACLRSVRSTLRLVSERRTNRRTRRIQLV